ncbi:MAG: peptidylprolyl isomerase [Verrucomicrobiota bacterium]|jgi:cyclophilin family peptidyl-prolyl cis-trans isomerase
MILRRNWRALLFLAAWPLLWNACQTSPKESAVLRDPAAPLWRQPAPQTFKVRVQTSIGDFVIQASRAWAPHGVDRFYHLVRAGFFDDSRFFRVDANCIAQFGIPGRPEIAALWQNQTMPADPPKSSNLRGTLGYAMTAPDQRTTQLYINLKDNPQNDAEGFAPIGRVVEGMDIVDRLYSGYGEASGGGMRAGRQARLFAEGNAWLDRDFPKLDKLLRAGVLPRARPDATSR